MIWRTKNVSIILAESSYSCETRQGSMELITMQHSEITITKRQISIRHQVHIEQHAVAWAVHGFDTELALMVRVLTNNEHIFLVFVPMSRFSPQISIIPELKKYMLGDITSLYPLYWYSLRIIYCSLL